MGLKRTARKGGSRLIHLLENVFAPFEKHYWKSFVSDVNEESPPEPAPPEVPPRGPSLHAATLRRRTEYALPVGENQATQESQFLTQGTWTNPLRNLHDNKDIHTRVLQQWHE